MDYPSKRVSKSQRATPPNAAGCRFVTRLRKNSPVEVIAMRHVLKDGPVVEDRTGMTKYLG